MNLHTLARPTWYIENINSLIHGKMVDLACFVLLKVNIEIDNSVYCNLVKVYVLFYTLLTFVIIIIYYYY